MSPLAARLAAIPIGLLAFAGHLMVTFWIQPLTWNINPSGVGLIVALAAIALTTVIPFAAYILAAMPLRRRPALLRIDVQRDRFVAHASPYYAGSQAILMMWLAGGMVMTERVPNGDHMRVAELPGAIPVSIVAVTVCFAAAMAFLLVNRPYVTLDRAGLTIQRLKRRVRISWDDLVAGGPPPPVKRNPRHIRLYVKGRPMLDRFPVSENIPIAWLHVDAAFLTAVIRRYVDQPEHRNEIGTETELIRLRSAFAEQPAATAQQST